MFVQNKVVLYAFSRQVKCEKYWPDESHTYGEIKVTVTQSRAFADYVTRTFLVEKVLTCTTPQLKANMFPS